MSELSNIGPYEILGELGRGGMGIVHRARDTRDGTFAALKILPHDAAARPEAALRFKLEFRAMRRVRHPNVIRVFESGIHDSAPYFSMEIVDGKAIASWLDDDEIVPHKGNVPPEGVLSVEQRAALNDPKRVHRLAECVVQVGYALGAIHRHRIVHRDLKPDNILVSRAGLVKLMDFGIAKQLNANQHHSVSGMFIGTFKYLSPEQAQGGDVDGRSDLYGLGLILYELLTGRHPFYSENSVGYAFHHAKTPLPKLSSFNPEVQPELAAVCERLLEKDPNDRFATAEDVIAAIRTAVDGVQVENKVVAESTATRARLERDALFNPGLVGRDRSLRAFSVLLSELSKGQGRVVLVPGDEGVGKTRLLRELGKLARAERVRAILGRGVSDAGEYTPYLHVLERMALNAKGPGNDLERFLDEDGPVLARYIPLLEQFGIDTEIAALSPSAERERFIRACGSVFERATTAIPHVVVLDDFHRFDELSIELTEQLTRRFSPDENDTHVYSALSFVIAFREPALSTNAQALISRLRDERALEIRPNALTQSEVLQMVKTMIGGGDVAAAIGEVLHQATGGVAGLVERKVRDWSLSGELRKTNQQWVFVKGAAAPGKELPMIGDFGDEGSTSQLVGLKNATRADVASEGALHAQVNVALLERLSPSARELGEAFAVLGERASLAQLSRLSLMNEEELLDSLEELLREKIIREDIDDVGSYMFTSDVLHKSLSQGIRAVRRRRVHRQVAELLGEQKESALRNAELIARHLIAAGDQMGALKEWMNAAKRSLELGATHTAAQRVQSAQDVLRDLQDENKNDPQVYKRGLDLIVLRMDVLSAVGEHHESVALAERRIPKLRRREDATVLGEVMLRLAQSELVLGRNDEALKHTASVLQLTERGRAHHLRCRAKNLCGQIYEKRGDHDLSQRYLSEALELARTIGSEREEDRARTALASRRLLVGDLAGAEREFRLLRDLAERRGEQMRVAAHVYALAQIAHERDELEEAEAGFRQMMKLARPSGDRRKVALGLCHMGIVRFDQGRANETLNLCDKAASVLQAIDDKGALAFVETVRSHALIERASFDDALTAAKSAIDNAQKAGVTLEENEAKMCLGLATILSDQSESTKDIDRALLASRRLQANRVVLFGLLALARAHLHLQKNDEALRVCDEGVGRARRTHFVRYVRRFEKVARQANALEA